MSATGRTGAIIADALVNSVETKFVMSFDGHIRTLLTSTKEVTALTRPVSINSEANKALAAKGVKIVLADLLGPKEALVKALTGTDVVISSIVFDRLNDQLPLAEAAKEAGVKRFVPCFWGTSAPRGVLRMYDQKLDVLAAVQRMYLPYTTIDVGWWSQQMIPKLPSGRTQHAAFKLFQTIPGDGNVPVALSDYRDIGNFVAKIIVDPRTLNKSVLAYTEVLTFNEIMELLSKLSGEKVEVPYTSAEETERLLKAAREAFAADPTDTSSLFAIFIHEYLYSFGVRGDNTPEAASYLGYLDFKALYPDFKGKTMKEMLTDVLEGKPSGYVDPVGWSFDDLVK
ncbi:LOW QUALITY PROTEIN: Phenylcoumaran benzylic ether reductase TP7 [Paramyrothecium foliicola]|nr:LOW QUALITY PROTEIN: Phenylcoumaran benzylic ether reductase TP7 [Paramyrothecium foliicola]